MLYSYMHGRIVFNYLARLYLREFLSTVWGNIVIVFITAFVFQSILSFGVVFYVECSYQSFLCTFSLGYSDFRATLVPTMLFQTFLKFKSFSRIPQFREFDLIL